ncbi:MULTISPECIES: CD1375 family protein [Clostridium]|uniref:CD1375 family protein n=1 Tax=Clostridium TaxID=1485 RepID=UPI0015D4BE44|nr:MULTISPECIES: CD1375 family protein [Clostridium]MDU4728004.1 CD1375 family protein [Clostridium sp.]
MVKVYADLVEAKERSLDGADGIKKVPDKYLDGVKEELKKRGYDLKDDITK